VSTPESTRSSRWLGRRYLFHIGRLGIPTFAGLLYLSFALGVVLGGYETGLDYLRFAASAVILLVSALIGARI
jgi:phosphatidylglycerol:prolipoprotein diacylglycerol transferase